MKLNQLALQRCDELLIHADKLRIAVSRDPSGTRLIDCGIRALGGLQAGRMLAEVCMAGLGRVTLVPGRSELACPVTVQVTTDHPVMACMAAQYAGWPVSLNDFFAMASGPMRVARGREPLLESIRIDETPEAVVGVLESGKLPDAAVCQQMAQECGVPASQLTLLVARTASLAGTLQVVARSIETALHKLHELGFDLTTVVSAMGHAPLPPVAADDLTAIGWTNDAVLYGGEVTLWVQADQAAIDDIGPRIPSSSSSDFGQPFAVLFERYGHDFYKIDPLLFSPALVTLINMRTGTARRFGQLRGDILKQSFESGRK